MLKDTNWTPPADPSFEESLEDVEADLNRDLLPYVARLEALLGRLALVPSAQRAEMGARLNLVIGRVKGTLGRL